MSVSVSIDGTEATHDALRGLVREPCRRDLAAMKQPHRRRSPGLSQHADRPPQSARSSREIFEQIASSGAHSWQLQITVAAGRVTDDPTLLLEPYHLIEVMPSMRSPRAARSRARPPHLAGEQPRLLRSVRGLAPRRHAGSAIAGRAARAATSSACEANGAVKACPSLPTAVYTGGSVRDDSLRDIWQRAEPLRFTRDDPRLAGALGTLQGLLLRRRVSRRMLVDRTLAVRPARQQPVLSPSRARSPASRRCESACASSTPEAASPSSTVASSSSKKHGPSTSSRERERSWPAESSGFSTSSRPRPSSVTTVAAALPRGPPRSPSRRRPAARSPPRRSRSRAACALART